MHTCVCDPAASFLLPPPFTALLVYDCSETLSVWLPEGVGVGVAACRISPSSLLATELFGAGRVREEKKDRNIKILNKNRSDREKERGIEKYATSGKSQGLRGLEKRERQIEF